MRNAVKIDSNLVVTVDNAGCIGLKDEDVVKVPNEVAAYHTARVGLLEQWSAGARPTHIFLSNFTSEEAWFEYEQGIKKAFEEIGEKMPPINGSTESNFASLQSGLSIMMVGKIYLKEHTDTCDWYVVGQPLVGREVIEQENQVAKLSEIAILLKLGIVKKIWPVGSKGLKSEFERLFKDNDVSCSLPLEKTSGPSTSVIVAIDRTQLERFKEIITTSYEKIMIN